MWESCLSGYGVHPITGLMGSRMLWGAGWSASLSGTVEELVVVSTGHLHYSP